jgi:imidazole glycerol phosphate synthase glutamine amidotransferase subunit
MLNAFSSLDTEPFVTSDPAIVEQAEFVVLPGVGAFAAGMAALKHHSLVHPLRQRIADRKPTLAVCLGLQLLCESSEEDPHEAGIGVIGAQCRRIAGDVSVPHLGWNAVRAQRDTRWVGNGYAAFANSYCIEEPPIGWRSATTTHGRRFVAALESKRTLACQFHPELSGSYGLELLRRWLDDVPIGDRRHNQDSGLTRRIIPCLDVRNGRVVKGVQFQALRDSGDPANRAAIYEQQGADEIVMLDVAASPEAQATRVDTVRQIREALHIPLTVGGGVRAVVDAERLLQSGADKISINTAAVSDPDLLTQLSDRFGTQCIVLAIDARRNQGSWEVLVSGGRDTSGHDAIEWAREGTSRGAGEILLTSWDRDGTQVGCDLALVQRVSEMVQVPLIASGGVGSVDHVADAIDAGADAVLAASMFHDDQLTVGDLKRELKVRGKKVRYDHT